MQTQTKQEITRICALDLDKELIEYLQQRFDVFQGSLGKRIKASYSIYGGYCRFLNNFSIPVNLHEYDVFIEDMSRNYVLDYRKEEHTLSLIEDKEAYYFQCQHPQTVFNPVCYGSFILAESLKTQRQKSALKIVFASEVEKVQYEFVNAKDRYDSFEETKTNYEHLHFPIADNICGTKVKLTDSKLSSNIFQSFLDDIQYEVVFEYPYKNISNKEVEDGFYSLLETPSGAILSFLWLSDYDITLVLPQTTRKKELLQKVFEEILFRHFTEYFPDVAESAWIKNEMYYLPNHENYIQQKDALITKYNEDIATINQKIAANNEKFGFLHTLLTASGEELVKAVIQFLKWLGFENVVDKDANLDKPFNEEDVQIDLGEDDINGYKLLVIEVKGIGGTSSDAECSQIHKVVHRRGKERKAYDVHGLYIVNNEMHKEPLKRSNPPFNDTQISDAVNDERGLCYTWQLFSVYFSIELGIISKEKVRNALFEDGLIDFTPSLTLVGTPHKYYKQHSIACLMLEDKEISCGDSFYYCQNGRWKDVQIVSIKDNDQSFDRVTSGNYGFGLSHKVPNNLALYIKQK